MAKNQEKSGNRRISESSRAKLIYDCLTRIGVAKHYHQASIKKSRIAENLTGFADHLGENIELGKGMLLLGPVGTGKTSAMVILLKDILGKFGHILSSGPEFRILKPDFDILFTNSNKIYNSIFRKDYDFGARCRKARVLMIDDFGREYYHDFPFSEFEDLVEHRYANQLCTFVTSNLTPDELKSNDTYQRVVDRWRECNDIVQISGLSMRKQQS